jgi:meso-butanediol dehydrogenase / (S,S)-butanediol dehydrogenase / diacetyl reductase
VNRFVSQTALIAGAGHGMGRATALRLAREGASIAVVDIRGEAAEETVSLLEAEGLEGAAWASDVSDSEQVDAVVKAVLDRFGRIDVLFSTAGVLIPGTVLTQSLNEWELTYEVNVRSIFLLARAVLPSMRANGKGTIVTIGSTSGLVGEPALAAYNSSKAAIVNLTRQMAADFSRDGIRVNCICPGWIGTGFNDPIFKSTSEEEIAEMVGRMVPIGRQGMAEEIAAAVAFLASDDASYVVGHALVVDGGLTAI